MLCQDGWRLAGGRSFGGLAGRRRRALTGTRGAHADSDGLLRLSRPDDDRNTSRPGYEIASRIHKPIIGHGPVATGRHSLRGPTSWNPKVICWLAEAAPDEREPAPPLLGDHQVEGRPTTNDQRVLCEQCALSVGVAG